MMHDSVSGAPTSKMRMDLSFWAKEDINAGIAQVMHAHMLASLVSISKALYKAATNNTAQGAYQLGILHVVPIPHATFQNWEHWSSRHWVRARQSRQCQSLFCPAPLYPESPDLCSILLVSWCSVLVLSFSP